MFYTEEIVKFIRTTEYEMLPNRVISAARSCFLDWLGSVYAGSHTEPVRILLKLHNLLKGEGNATIIPDGSKSSPLYASFSNGASSHANETDDVHRASIFHPAAPIIPVSLAVAENENLSGKDLITSIVVGYEVGIRVGEAVGTSHYKYWHTTGTCGTFGAATAAGKLLDLNQKQLHWALGNAGSQASGLWEFLVDGAMSKQLHPGKAAFNGLLAALLARENFTGAIKILEGEKGFCQATSSEYDLEKLTRGLGKNFKILEVSFKPHASCRHTHAAIDATISLVKRMYITPNDIERINIRLYSDAFDLLKEVHPKNPYAAKFCLPFCIASAIKHHKVGLSAFTKEWLMDQEMQNIMKKVTLTKDTILDQAYPQKWGCIVEIKTSEGKNFNEKVEYPKGDPENPLKKGEIIGKFMDLSQNCLSKAKARSLVNKIDELENIKEMRKFFD